MWLAHGEYDRCCIPLLCEMRKYPTALDENLRIDRSVFVLMYVRPLHFRPECGMVTTMTTSIHVCILWLVRRRAIVFLSRTLCVRARTCGHPGRPRPRQNCYVPHSANRPRAYSIPGRSNYRTFDVSIIDRSCGTCIPCGRRFFLCLFALASARFCCCWHWTKAWMYQLNIEIVEIDFFLFCSSVSYRTRLSLSVSYRIELDYRYRIAYRTWLSCIGIVSYRTRLSLSYSVSNLIIVCRYRIELDYPYRYRIELDYPYIGIVSN